MHDLVVQVVLDMKIVGDLEEDKLVVLVHTMVEDMPVVVVFVKVELEEELDSEVLMKMMKGHHSFLPFLASSLLASLELDDPAVLAAEVVDLQVALVQASPLYRCFVLRVDEDVVEAT